MTEVVAGSRRLLAVAWRQHRGRLITATVLMVLGAVAAPLSALTIRWLVDEAVAGHPTTAMLAGGIGAVLVIVALNCSNFAHIAYFELAELSMLEIECQLIRLSNGSPGIAHHEQPDFADRLVMVRQGIRRLRNALESLLALVGVGLTMTVTAALLARLNPLLLLLIPLAVLPLLTGRRAERIVDAAKLSAAPQNRAALSLFRLCTQAASAKEIRAQRLQEELVKRHRLLWGDVTRRMSAAHISATVTRSLGQVLLAVGYLLGVLLVIRNAVSGVGTVGDVVLSITLAAQVNTQVANAVSLLQELQTLGRTMAHLDEIRDLVADPGPGADAGRRPPRGLSRGIELSGVTFAYPGSSRPVLRDINLLLPAGATVAIVGENGAGKSTLVKLLARLYEPTAGRISVDGTALADIAVPWWRECVSVGFQDFVRFELTVQEAVGVGDLPNISSREAVLAALDRVQFRHVVQELPEGLATHLGKRHTQGVELSGGQWQRIALGRSFMRTAPLLLMLDEPSSALDAEVEHVLFERYAEVARRTAARTGAVTVLVSHRFATVRMADLIVTLADGRVAEAGDHDALMRAKGLYAELFGLQAKAYR